MGRLAVLQQKLTQREVDGVGIAKDLRKVWFEEDEVRSLAISLEVLAANAATEIVFVSHLVV
jgi:hypothetical protein